MKTIIRLVTRFIPRRYLNQVSHFFSRIIGLFYLGNRVQCPVCGAKYRKFLPYGRFKTRENALCPNCLSLERHRLMWLYLQEKTDFFTASLKILHVAPEYCFLKRFEKLDNLDYITADLESPLAKVKMDVHDIPFEDNSFDVVFCNHTLEHVDDDLKALRELYRILKPGGWGIIQSPINIERKQTYEDASISSEKDREIHFGQKDHVREYGLDYPLRLEKAGFTVNINKSIEQMDPEEIKRFGLLTYDKITAEDYLYTVDK